MRGERNNYFDHQIRSQHFLHPLDLGTCCSVVIIRKLGSFTSTWFHDNTKTLLDQGLNTSRRQCHPFLILENLLGDTNSQLFIWNSYKGKKKKRRRRNLVKKNNMKKIGSLFKIHYTFKLLLKIMFLLHNQNWVFWSMMGNIYAHSLKNYKYFI